MQEQKGHLVITNELQHEAIPGNKMASLQQPTTIGSWITGSRQKYE